MVNTEQARFFNVTKEDYNILNIVVNTELCEFVEEKSSDYNILNIVVNTEHLS